VKIEAHLNDVFGRLSDQVCPRGAVSR
jgi:hypothetical protein